MLSLMERWSDSKAEELIHAAHESGAPLTGALRALADAFGYIDEAAYPALMQAYARSRAEVLGVVSWYEDFRTRPPGRHVLRLCQAEACQAVGARELTAYACSATGLRLGDTSADGALTLEGVYCLGLCANGPAGELDGRPLAELDAAALDARLAEAGE